MLKPRICPFSTMRFATGSLMLAAILRLPSSACHDARTEPTAPPSCSTRIGKGLAPSLAVLSPFREYMRISAAVRSSGSFKPSDEAGGWIRPTMRNGFDINNTPFIIISNNHYTHIYLAWMP